MYNMICGLSAYSGEMYSLIRLVNSVGEVCASVLINDLTVLRSYRLIPSRISARPVVKLRSSLCATVSSISSQFSHLLHYPHSISTFQYFLQGHDTLIL